MKIYTLSICLFIIYGCSNTAKSSYTDTITPIAKKTKIIELVSNNGIGRIAIAPEIQGKILTTTYDGLEGNSNGWINKSAFNNGEINFDAIGGEDRIWLGPLGSQHSFYFQQIKPLAENNWLVPPSLSSEPYELVKFDIKEVLMSKQMKLVNFTGTEFNIQISRSIKLLEKENIEKNLNIDFEYDLKHVAYESSHILKNIGNIKWQKETGLVALWNAGMFEGSEKSVVIIPLKKKSSLDAIYKYMGPLNSDRLALKNNVILFKADGKYRSKIGVPNIIAPAVYGCYSKDKNRLTIVQYKKTPDSLFSNSHVSIQGNPYQGEVIPIYNNGTMDYSKTNETSFFELESTSPFKELEPSESVSHFHRVYHFSGDEKTLSFISEKLLGIQLNQCILPSN